MADRIGQATRLRFRPSEVGLLAAILIAATMSIGGTGCTPASVSSRQSARILEQVRTRPLIVSFEGLQPFSGTRARNVTRSVAVDLGMAHSATSGNPAAHREFVREAKMHGQPIYIVGYSMGCTSAVILSQWCKAEGIPVRILFLLDPAVLPKIPDNVAHVVVVESTSARLAADVNDGRIDDPKLTSVDQLTLPGIGHGSLPYQAISIIRYGITADRPFTGDRKVTTRPE